MKFPYKRYGYKLSASGTYTTLFGKPCKKVSGWTPEELKSDQIVESDINPEIRILTDMYLEEDSVSENHNILFIDIEVSGEGGNSLAKDANNEITAISFYCTKQKEEVILLLDKQGIIKNNSTDNIVMYSFRTENELLIAFIKLWKRYNPTIVVGWNSDSYDIPYLCNRISKILTHRYLEKLSPFGIVEYNPRTEKWKIAGINCLDLMLLYKKYTPNEKSSYALDLICKEELKHGKFEHGYGSLEILYNKDLAAFIKYNITDVRLLVELEDKLQYISQTLAICHDSHIPYESIYATSISLDAATLVFLHRNNIVAPNKSAPIIFPLADDYEVGDTKIYLTRTIPSHFPKVGVLKIFKSKTAFFKVEYINHKGNCFILKEPLPEMILKEYRVVIQLIGAFVKEPIAGIYKWLFDLDLASLYPSIIMTLNISPETKFGRILNWDVEEYYKKTDKLYRIQYINGKEVKLTLSEFESLIITGNHYSIASNGTMYCLDKKGILPAILEKWFGERSVFKNYRDEAFSAGDMAKYALYDQKQYTKKIQLNSFYGALALTVFRYYDISSAEAVTSTGMSIIKFTERCGNKYYNKILSTDNKDYVQYVDTDSVFLSALPILIHRKVDISNIDVTIRETVLIATEVQNYINEMYGKFAIRNLFVVNHKLKIKQENIALAGIWVAKKRYALWMIYKEGNRVNKLDVKGIDVVRSDFPKIFQNSLSNILTAILNLKSTQEVTSQLIKLRNELTFTELNNILYSKGVKGIEEYDIDRIGIFKNNKGAPVQVKSAINHNDFLLYHNIISDIIRSNSKIKWTYLKKNPYRIKSIAMKGYDDPAELIEFVTTYIDYERIFSEGFVSKVQEFYDAAGWGKIQLNETVDKFFEF
jgi:DNA polymerase elongation subunit (family B)